MKYILSFIIAYLIGSISGSIMLSKLIFNEDIRKKGSSNAGTTNMYRAYGFKYAFLAFVIDFLKGTFAPFLAYFIDNTYGPYIAGTAVVIGHIWPIYHNFKGGKGMATSVGVFGYLTPLLSLIQATTFLILLKLVKIVSAISMIVTFVGIVYILAFNFNNKPLVIMTIINSILVIYSHRENIKRLINGEEKPLKRLEG